MCSPGGGRLHRQVRRKLKVEFLYQRNTGTHVSVGTQAIRNLILNNAYFKWSTTWQSAIHARPRQGDCWRCHCMATSLLNNLLLIFYKAVWKYQYISRVLLVFSFWHYRYSRSATGLYIFPLRFQQQKSVMNPWHFNNFQYSLSNNINSTCSVK